MSAAPTFGKHVPADGICDGWRMNNAGPQKRSPFFTVIPSGGKRQIDLKDKRTFSAVLRETQAFPRKCWIQTHRLNLMQRALQKP